MRRNATVGGNLCAPAGDDAQRGDLGAALIALGAQVRSVGAGGERTEPVEDFLGGDRGGRLVLDVSYERRDRRSATASLRRRHAHSYAIATVAASTDADGTRIGITGIGPTAVRPSTWLANNSLTVCPSGVIAPIPVMTTRLRMGTSSQLSAVSYQPDSTAGGFHRTPRVRILVWLTADS